MDAPLPAPAAEPLRSPVLVSALLAVPGAAYTAWALVPWARGTLLGPYGGNTVALLSAVLLFSGALVALAAGGTALLTRRDHRAAWTTVVLVAAAALAWLVSPGGIALTTATLD